MRPNRETNGLLQSKTSGWLSLLILATWLALLFTASCSRAGQRPGDTLQTRANVPGPTSTVAPTISNGGTENSEHPPATFTPAPTLTSPPTATAAPLLPTAIVSESQFSGQRNRLSGEVAVDPALLQRRPLAVKISNAPAKWTRPQSGLSQADLVFEHVTEGTITRFTAIFFGSTPPKLGPIRSARLIDLQLPAMYDAALVYSGSSIGVSRQMFASDFSNRILRTNTPGYFRTGENKPYEHTLYADPIKLWQTLEERGENREPEFNSVMAFSQAPPQDGTPAGSLIVRYYRFSTVEWRYDPVAGHYLRWADGEKHTDANSGEQISADNVVVLVVRHVLDETICEFQSGNVCMALSMEIQLWGEGQALLLRDGMAYEVTWSRQQRHELLRFLDDNRQPFPLQLGKTWFQVVPTDYPEAFSIAP